MSEKALCKGQPKPPTEVGKLRLYSMRFCPHSAKCRLALLAKNVPHDVVNINLRRQPDWFMELNPAGTVPVLEVPNGKVIVDASLIIEHIEGLGGESLYVNKVEEAALMEKAKQLFKSTEDVISGKIQNDLSTGLSDVYHAKMNELENHLKAKGTKFLFRNDKPSIADFCIFPLLNEAQSLCDVLPSLIKPVDMGTHPKLNDYIDAMGASEFGSYVDYFDLVAFHKGLIMDKEYLYNEGLF
ncbi:glutathione S-transferase omega-1 [Galendromus occidentalis]|uniref:Glutathione S-transferase omega-1 n=1 Tax=Galendromus occidentalis TaxID=34638 RepID=A0AAJ6QN32_9ACAR|nr:glutathione S-transferase omega-1 [Galendromus occidentalis]